MALVQTLQNWYLSPQAKELIEKYVLGFAIISFILHLALYGLVSLEIINIPGSSELLSSPIAAIYTPFSFILLYEVYLLVYYLPKSITTYVRKQYEIITLIIIRRLFKDLATLELSSQWFQIKDDLQFTYDIIASIILFFLLFLFYRVNNNYRKIKASGDPSVNTQRFIRFKTGLAVALVPILLGMALYTLVSWLTGVFMDYDTTMSFKDLNSIFFDEFFTILIIVDVVLLLLSFYHTDKFHQIIRNSGFVISTILLRLSFSVDGLLNDILIVAAVVFGLLVMYIHNLFENSIDRGSK